MPQLLSKLLVSKHMCKCIHAISIYSFQRSALTCFKNHLKDLFLKICFSFRDSASFVFSPPNFHADTVFSSIFSWCNMFLILSAQWCYVVVTPSTLTHISILLPLLAPASPQVISLVLPHTGPWHFRSIIYPHLPQIAQSLDTMAYLPR